MGSHECPHTNHTHHQFNTPLHHRHHRHCPFHHHRHHHHHRHCPHCQLYNHHCHRNFQWLPYFTPLPHNPLPLATHPISDYINNEAITQISQELEHVELDAEEQDDDPVFVLTDEWREFFAKSEARRKLEKKQSKKGKK